MTHRKRNSPETGVCIKPDPKWEGTSGFMGLWLKKTCNKERGAGALLGLACGDAIGAAVEFKPRGSFAPVTDMRDGGPFKLPAGYWTDDTSMALCLADSLISQGDFDARDQMLRYCAWYEQGVNSSTGACFDIGTQTQRALQRFKRTGDPFAGDTQASSAGNGSIMRLAPIPVFFSNSDSWLLTEKMAAESSRTTHGTPECVDACRVLAVMIWHGVQARRRKETILQESAAYLLPTLTPRIAEIVQGSYRTKAVGQISSSGYVVDTLEAALWCVWHHNSFEAAVLAAANLGDDADTVAAVTGQLAGAIYGKKGIPEAWLAQLRHAKEIEALAVQLVDMPKER